MKNLIKALVPDVLIAAWRRQTRSQMKNKRVAYEKWGQDLYRAPCPMFVKRAVILRHGNPNATWIESGTYLGETTELLSRTARLVLSIEPEPTLYSDAVKKFAGTANVEIVNGASEHVLPTLLQRVTGDVNFWLDGHDSAGTTFKGNKSTPIIEELTAIGNSAPRFGRVVVLVDDIRLFSSHDAGHAEYPSLDFLVDWARTNGLTWSIEHDIFIAKREPANSAT
ncbi:hypothetical protein [Burkholderia sp.]|uniref:hypothetical protein n=1 Tax=Burkholderia sp. TaxID=36773 RepID=UPI00258FD803|nr:hypothetical protein [Burkholderia sp.]MCA3072066.1 hypothetical protein [Rhodocyclaceae bacterium]MCA3073743.1 hypothetical protein [Rhodocyclaceae bacterium]MCA3091726.1 hypothetical protein [Rhodocyclaceae bacterium]MCA3093380.1 hypothetical protein [Rhodocyclaceae bacterium]MCA3096197.1 hypothetical protein [Rhodocyclaceae bacterium]